MEEGKSDQNSTRKTNKTRRETAVQGTNDSSIVSKCSTSSCGYFNDPYLHYFVSKHSRRAPLIHRGYYIRAVAFDRILKNFLQRYGHSKKQIISLGCGFDSSYFRLKAAGLLNNTVFCEIDFPELVKRKRLLIENTPDLVCLVEKTGGEPLSPHIELSCLDYHLLGVDLTQVNTLEAALKMCGVDFEAPTLLLSECVMTYMTRRCSTELVKWAAETFEEAVFGMYEQMNPDDAFGLFMQNHFHSIGSPLKCINSFPTLEAQTKRFINAGWAWCEALDMNTFYYHHVPAEEQKRIQSLETFDEYEELNLKYSHYFMLTASTVSQNNSLITEGKQLQRMSLYPPIYNILTVSRVSEDLQSVRRFGHSSSLVYDQFAIISGGFGEIDGRHQRLAEITITDLNTFRSFHVPCGPSDVQCSRMHHASVSLSDGTTFLIGGRQSPYFLCNQMLKIRLHLNPSVHKHLPEVSVNLCDKGNSLERDSTVASASFSPSLSATVTSQQTDSVSSSSTKQMKHLDSSVQTSATGSDIRTNKSAADSYGHCQCDSGKVMIDCDDSRASVMFSWTCELGKVDISVITQNGELPRERWRHAAVAVSRNGKEKIFLYGGKTKCGEVLEDSFLFDPVTNMWEQVSCSGEKPGPRHSHCLTMWNGQVLMTGGLDSAHFPTSDVFALDMITYKWERLALDGTLFPRYSHTAHLSGDRLLVVGGVNLHHPPPGVAVINLRTRKALEFALPVQEKSSLLMFHRHASVALDCEKLVVLGGGGNCFSFGTHLNKTPVIVNVGACMDAAE